MLKKYHLIVFISFCYSANLFSQYDTKSDSLILNSVFIDSIKIDENYRMKINRSGCYNSSTIDLLIKRKINGYYFSASKTDTSFSEILRSNKKIYPSKKITNIQLDCIRTIETHFAMKLVNAQKKGFFESGMSCRDLITYKFQIKSLNKQYNDITCDEKILELLKSTFGIIVK